MAAAIFRGSWTLAPSATTFSCTVVFVVTVTLSAYPSSAGDALELPVRSLAMTPDELMAERILAGLNQSDCRDQCSEETNETRMCECRNSAEECRHMGDCCADIFLEEVPRPRLGCVPAFGPNLIGVVRCPDTWSPASDDDETKLRCEEEKREKLTLSYVDDLPALSQSGVLYRNAYCALCNGDTRNLRPWELLFHCTPKDAFEALKNGTASDVRYSSSTKRLSFPWNNRRNGASCRIAIKQMLEKDFDKNLNVTTCKPRPLVRTCPDNYTNADVRAKCHSYASMVEYSVKMFLYRNIHCAICNGASPKDLSCHLLAQLGPDILRSFPMGASYAIVMDFSSWQGGPLPNAPMRHSCGLGELHDVVSNRCVKSGCPADKCVQRNDCHWTLLTVDKVQVRNDSFLVISSSSEKLEPARWHKESANAVIACLSSKDDATALRPADFENVLSTILLLISVVCVILHIIAYALLPKLRTGPSRLVLCLAVSVLLAQGTFVAGGLLLTPGSAFCSACSVVSHGTHLAAFFWMNVMAMDVHRTFRKGISGSSRAVSAFVAYSAYAWLAPTVLVAAACTTQYLQPDSPWSPSYGSPYCWINRPLSLIAFFGAPVLLLLLANTVFFLLTARSIHQTAKQTKLARRASAGPGTDQGRLILYAKLAVVFGLTWVFGFAAALTGLRALWYPFIVLCGLQGAFIFLAFTFKRSVFRMVRERLCGRRRGRRRRPRSASTTLTTALHSTLSASSSALASVATGRSMPTQSTSSPKGVQKPLLRRT